MRDDMHTQPIVEFVAPGTPRALSHTIEEHAKGRGAVSILLVPWESDDVTVRMAVTLVKTDGWAIEHTNLGTVSLTDLGENRTQVAIFPDTTDRPDQQDVTSLLGPFARQLQGRLQAGDRDLVQ
jgi:hypothetical protein